MPDTSSVERAFAILETFEREYLSAQLERHGNSTTKAAAAAGVGRVYLYKLLKRHGLR